MTDVVTIIHLMGGAAFAITLILMQLAVGPAMGKISAGPEKEQAMKTIQGRARLSMDIVIIIMCLTAAYLLVAKWPLIMASPWLHVKITFGTTALAIGVTLHFHWRAKKQRLKEAGKADELKALNKRSFVLERLVLVLANIAWMMGVLFNHI